MSPQSIHANAAAALVAVLFLGPALGHASSRDVVAARPDDLSNLGIDNFGRVNLTYYRGAEPADDQYAALATLGIKTVIDLRSHDVDAEDKLLVEGAGMQYAHIPMTTHDAPTPSIVEAFLKIVADPANQPVYVHCVGGRHRTGVMTAVYRMNHDRWTAERAFTEMKQYKFGADFLHPEFKEFVFAYRADPILTADAGE